MKNNEKAYQKEYFLAPYKLDLKIKRDTKIQLKEDL